MDSKKKFELDRRRFLEGLGIGAGGCFLSPLFSNIFSEAFAQSGQPQQRFIVLYMNAMPRYNQHTENKYRGSDKFYKFLPKSTRSELDMRFGSRVMGNGITNQAIQPSEWPAFFNSWKPMMDNARIIEGIKPRIGLGHDPEKHGIKYSGLSGVINSSGSSKGDKIGKPGGPSIDQVIANGPSGANKPHKSVLIGLGKEHMKNGGMTAAERDRVQKNGSFARAKAAPVPFSIRFRALENKLFGDGVQLASGAQQQGSEALTQKRKRIIDVLNKDVNRMRRKLAHSEKMRLDNYMNSLNEFDAQKDRVGDVACSADNIVSDAFSTKPGKEFMPERELIGLVDAATIALNCGLTNVVGITAGTTGGHNSDISYKKNVDEVMNQRFFESNTAQFSDQRFYTNGFSYHVDAELWDKGHVQYTQFYINLITRMLENMSGRRGVMPPNTTAILLSDRGMKNAGDRNGHHTSKDSRWPIFMLSSNPKLRTGGEYHRYAENDSQKIKLLDFFRTLSLAFDTQMDPDASPIANLLKTS